METFPHTDLFVYELVSSGYGPELCCGLICSVVSDSETPWTIDCKTPLSMGFSRQECWSRLPCPSPGDLPDPGIEPGLLHCRQILYSL